MVIEAGVTELLEFLLLPCFSFSGDQCIVFFEGGIILVKQCRYPRLILVGRIGEDEAGDFSGFRTGEADRETGLEEDFSDSSKVVVLCLAGDGGEGLDGSFEFGGDV